MRKGRKAFSGSVAGGRSIFDLVELRGRRIRAVSYFV